MVTGYPSIDIAVDAIRYGAADFIVKPFSAEKLEFAVRKAIDLSKQYKELSAINQINNIDVIGSSVGKGSENGDVQEGATAGTAVKVSEDVHRSLQVKTRRLEDKVKELSVLHTISDTLDDTKEKGEIFRKIMELAVIITGAERAFVGLVNNDKNELIVRGAINYTGSSPVGRKFDAGKEPFRSVIKKLCYSYSFVDDKSFTPLVGNMVAPFDRAPLLSVPIIINGEPIAILGLCGKEGLMQFSEDNIAMLLNLATKASLKLENISLANNIFSNILATIDSLINALDARDTYTKDHSHRVTQYALSIARSYGADQGVMDSISFAGPLHDIGKIGVRDDILLKEGSFTTEERNVMKSHALRGEEILKPLNLLNIEKAVVLNHHERWDGSGYPEGLKGEEIPVVARIVLP
jgi:response regulator RpfG family c-di-GMP phosphodiesterase